ncbi:hypothetical protein ACF08W_28820 [Streptomyces sp. NPDC015144]|uniref:hypothetical protein n=1 Tax=Streptomyces sp. NPDC015144 TaxID=3364944 RepID=UPI003700845C
MSAVDQALDAVYAAAREDQEAHRIRIPGELDAIAEDLTETLRPPKLRAAGFRFTYTTEEIA